MGNTFYPTGGYLLDVGHGAPPGCLAPAERERLRNLAHRVIEIAALPKQEVKRDLWYRHNRLEKVRPLLLLFPEDSWAEILGEELLQIADPFWRQWEWYLEHLLYRDARFADDYVTEPELYVVRSVRTSGWGLESRRVSSTAERGAWRYDPPIKDAKDIDKLRAPATWVDEAVTQQAFQAVGEELGNLLPVRIYCGTWANPIGVATSLRGIQQVMIDMYERPEWLHELMRFISEAQLKQVTYLEENGYLTLNNGHHYVDSGGLGYATELPVQGFAGTHVRLCDVWGHAEAQEFSLVSPAQHEEFALAYQLPLLERCGLNSYGCCEPLTRKFEMLRKVPRLRRVSVSPWCDVEVAASALQDKCIFSWKPDPSLLVGTFDPEAIRAAIRHTLEVARGCVLEIVLKDTITVDHDPARLETWSRIARQEIERLE